MKVEGHRWEQMPYVRVTLEVARGIQEGVGKSESEFV